MHYNPFPFLEDNNSTSPLQKGVRGAEWFVTEETTYMKSASPFSTFMNVTYIPKAMYVVILPYL